MEKANGEKGTVLVGMVQKLLKMEAKKLWSEIPIMYPKKVGTSIIILVASPILKAILFLVYPKAIKVESLEIRLEIKTRKEKIMIKAAKTIKEVVRK